MSHESDIFCLHPNSKKRQSGFSLVEILIAVTIMAVLGFAVYSTFSQGVRVWRYANRENPELNVGLLFEKMSSDVRNSFAYRAAETVGTKREVLFYAVGDFENLKKKKTFVKGDQPIRIRYYYDPKFKVVNRETMAYPGILNPQKDSAVLKTVLEGVTDFEIFYYDPDPMKKRPDWRREWRNVCLPRAIKLKIQCKNLKKPLMTKIIPIPSSNYVES